MGQGLENIERRPVGANRRQSGFLILVGIGDGRDARRIQMHAPALAPAGRKIREPCPHFAAAIVFKASHGSGDCRCVASVFLPATMRVRRALSTCSVWAPTWMNR